MNEALFQMVSTWSNQRDSILAKGGSSMTARKLKQPRLKTQKALPFLTACDSHNYVECPLPFSRLVVPKFSLRFAQYVFERRPLSWGLTSAEIHGWGCRPHLLYSRPHHSHKYPPHCLARNLHQKAHIEENRP